MVGAAVRFVDGFTGLPITDGSGAILSRDGKSSIRKQDGYYIFWDDGEPVLRLSAGGGIYQKEYQELSLDMLRARLLPSFSVYLYPSEAYPFPPGIGWEKAQAADMRITVPWNASKNVVRLSRDGIQGRTSLFLRAAGNLVMADRTIWLGRGEELLCLRLGEQLDALKGEYALTEPLSLSWDERETDIYLAYGGKAGEDGGILTPYFLT